MNVILVRPPSIMGGEHSHALQHPINLCWLAAFCRRDGARPSILDYEVLPYSPGHFTNAITELKPRVIGFTSMTPSITAVAEMAKTAAGAAPDAALIIGGAHASILPGETLKAYPWFRAAVIGEGEQAFLEIRRAVETDTLGKEPIPSVVINTGEGLLFGDKMMPPIDLDTLPAPARELLDLKLYSGAPTPGIPNSGARATQLFTSRGCPGKCIFCCSERIFGRRVRSRGVEHVMDEIRDCAGRFGFRHFTIDNDTFTYDRGFVAIRFCDEAARLKITWDCDTRVDRVDEEMIRAMAASGCLKVAFGVETGSEKILKLIRKGITLDQVREAFRMTRRAGMMSCAFLMLGNHPEENEEDIRATSTLVREIRPDLISVALATPYPGTQLRETMLAEGLLDEGLPWGAYSQSFQGKPFIRTKTLSSEQLLQLQSEMLRRFYLRPGYILRRLAALRRPGELAYWFSAGIGFLKYIFSRRGNARV